MRSRPRLRVLLPAAAALAVAVLGLALFQLGVGPLGLGSDDDASVAASAAGASGGEASSAEPAPAADENAETTPGSTPFEPEAPAEEPPPPTEDEATTSGNGKPKGMAALDAELEAHSVVVLVTYLPDGAVDGEVTRAARLAADDVKVGFVSVNASKEKQIEELALTYDLRDTPAVLVFRRGPELQTKLVGWADRETIAQAAQTAKRVA